MLSGEARNSVDADRAVAIAKSMVTTDDGREVDPDKADKYVINSMQRRGFAAGHAESPFRRGGPHRGARPGCELVRRQQGRNRRLNSGLGDPTAGPLSHSRPELRCPPTGQSLRQQDAGGHSVCSNARGIVRGPQRCAPFGVGLFKLAAGGTVDPAHLGAGREGTCARPGGAGSCRSLRRYREFSRGRRISRAVRAVLVGYRSRYHYTVLSITACS